MIGNRLFINLEDYIDVTDFDSLHPEICRGIATARHLSRNGLHTINPGTIHSDAQGFKIKTVYEAYSEWNALPDDDPLKLAGQGLDYNQLTTYLKYAFGGYDLYSLYILFDDTDGPIQHSEINEHFPGLSSWILNLVNRGILKEVHTVTLFTLEASGLPWEHCDPEPSWVGNIATFVHVKTDLERPFYMVDPTTSERLYMNTRVAWWDETDWHGGEPVNHPTYTLRINGWFTEELKKKAGI